MPLLIDGEAIAGRVALDGLSRLVVDDAGAQHVLYLPDGGALPASMFAAEWLAQRGPLPADPTPEQIADAIAAREAARQQALADAAALRQQILTIAQSAIGVRVDLLTAGQVRALFAILLWKEGAIKNDLTVRALAEWAA
jgi:hypothetical protein